MKKELFDERARGYIFSAFYVCLLVLAATLSAKIGLSHYFARKADQDQSFARALFFDQKNPEAYVRRGDYALAKQDFSSAVENYLRAADLRKNDFVLWTRLGSALAKLGERDRAKAAYQNSLDLAPHFAQPNRLMGLLLLEKGRDEQAFEYLRKGAEADQALYPELLQIALRRYPSDISSIERFADPRSTGQKKLLAAFMINHDLMSIRLKTLLTGDLLSDTEKDLFVTQLLSKNKTRLAYEIWSTKSGVVNILPAAGEKVIDGSFEGPSAGNNTFGWRLGHKLEAVSVAVDSARHHSGSRALNIQYKGDLDPGATLFSQLVAVEPNTNYRLSFAVLSTELTSGALPVITVTGGHTPLAKSHMIEATGGKWFVKTIEFRSGKDDSVVIALQRANCVASLCPIFGDLSLDDVSMVEAASR